MRICIFGVGAVGGLIAARTIMSGADVYLFDQDDRLQQLRSKGLKFISGDNQCTQITKLQILDQSDHDLVFDVLILAIKAHDIPGCLGALRPLISLSTTVVTTQNGIPWWYFSRCDSLYEGHILRSVDPAGSISEAIDPRQIIGCVVYPAAELLSDGSVRHVEGSRFSFGELDGSSTDRVRRISQVFDAARFKSLIIKDIRDEIWLKALGNLSFNPVSALTRMTMKDIFDFASTRELVRAMMTEAEQVAHQLGAKLRVSVERRLAGAGKVGHHRTSMLQDLEAGRALEIDGLLGAVIEIATLLNIQTPTLRTVYSLTKAIDCQPNRSDRYA